MIALVSLIVPRHVRAEWREEWEAELGWRERRLAGWDAGGERRRRELLRRSTGAFWDALWLQRQRREDEMVQDLRFGLRMLAKRPAFTAVAVFTLALGIGANTAVFSFVNALLLRPLAGVTRPGELVQVGRQYPDKSYMSDSSYPDFLDYRAQNTVMSGLAAAALTSFHVRTGTSTERVEGELVSGDYFAVLGVVPAHGRLISPADDRAGAGPVAIVSTRFWRRSLGGGPDVVGKSIELDGHAFTLIGVADEQFSGIRLGTPHDVWVPFAALRQTNPNMAPRFDQRRASWLEMFGRLKPGVSLEQARAEFSAIARRLEETYPDTNARAAARVEPDLGRDLELAGALRRFVYLPFAAVVIVLLIACANVAGLLLARAVARQREIATRLALGAARIRIVRQLLTESVALALAGGAAGLVVGMWMTTWLRSLLPDRFLFLSFDIDFGLDWRVFAFTLATATATGLLFGLVPALHASRADLVPAFKASRASGGRAGSRVRRVLVVTEVALSLVLLVAAGLCIRTLVHAAAVDTGYQVQRILTARVELGGREIDPERGRMLQHELVERLHALRDVEAAALAVTLPLNDSRWEDGIRREGDGERIQTFLNLVTSQYFDVMGIPMLGGRPFASQDTPQSHKVAILNQALARILWPGETALGRRLTFKGETIEVVGVVRDIRGRDLFASPGAMMYLPLTQHYHRSTIVHLRTAVPPARLVASLRAEIGALDPGTPVHGVGTLDEHVTATLTPQRLLAHVTAGFGILALLLAVVGLYALVSGTITERTQEIGIRMALGAHHGDVMRLVLTGGMKLVLSGVAIGLAAASGLTHFMQNLLFGVSPVDPLTLLLAPMLLIAAALTACWVPAHRAARADPTSALRHE